MKSKNITIDELAVMVQKGFLETAKKDDVDKRFEAVDKRFDAVDKRFDKMEKKLDRIAPNHEERIEKLEGDVKELKDLLV
jgi:DNA anti-recombination protein RmuC